MTFNDMDGIREYAQETAALRTSPRYRRKLAAHRFSVQYLHGGKEDRSDFIRFIKGKLTHKKTDCLPMTHFDSTRGREREVAHAVASAYSADPHGRSILLFSMFPFYTSGGGQRCAQLAKTFSKLGYDVIYLYLGDNFYTLDRDFIDAARIHQPMQLYSIDEVVELARSAVAAIFEYPAAEFLPVLIALNKHGIPTIYEHIDNWETELGNGWYSREIWLRFLSEAYMLTTTSMRLKELVQMHTDRPVHYIANAVDTDLFDPDRAYDKPTDMVLGTKTLLYYGHLMGEWHDWDLLFNVAESNPSYAFNIIGVGDMKALRALPPNIHILGSKLQNELPAYLCYSDFALLPFALSDIGVYVSPLKIFEYLAMHVPVISTPLPDITGYPNVICSSSVDEWSHVIRDGIPAQPSDDFVHANSWYARCQAILMGVESL